MLGVLSVGFFLLGLALAYWFWFRPILRTRPQMKVFYTYTNSFWTALWAKFAFIKSKLLAAFMMVASGLISVHDFLLPAAAGIDWSPLYSKVPDWSWPLISFAVAALFYWLHQLKENEQTMVTTAMTAGTSLADARMLLTAPEATS